MLKPIAMNSFGQNGRNVLSAGLRMEELKFLMALPSLLGNIVKAVSHLRSLSSDVFPWPVHFAICGKDRRMDGAKKQLKRARN